MAKRFLSNINVNDQYTLPSADGTSGQIIQTDGSGNLSFVDFASNEARKIIFNVKNKDSISLSKGTVVHASPSANPPSGNIIEVIRADNNDSSKMPAIGVLNETLAVDAEGECVMLGSVSGIATNSFNVGDELYVSDTPGEFINTKPTGTSNLIQKIAIVIKSHSTNGLIEVFGAGRANDVPNQIDRNVNFTDNSKLTFGDSTTPDFQIYHDGNNSYINEDGTGVLAIQSNGTEVQINKGTSEYMARFITDGAVNLYYDNSKKFETTSTGVSVTGSGTFTGDVTLLEDLYATNQNLKFHAGGTQVMNIDVNGKVYPNTHNAYDIGHSASLAWRNIYSSGTIFGNAATFAGSVGIGTTSPSYKLQVSGVQNANDIVINNTTTGVNLRLQMIDAYGFMFTTGSKDLLLGTNNTERMRIDSSGRVGINQTSPSSFFSNASQLVIGDGSTSRGMTIYGSSAGDSQIFFADGTTGNQTYRGIFRYEHSSDSMVMFTSATERMRIDSAGNVGIGETTPLGKLHVKASDTTASANSAGNLLVLEDSENGMSILSSTSGAGYILFGDSGDNDIGGILYDHSANAMRFRTNGVWDRLRIDSSGNTTFAGDITVTGGDLTLGTDSIASNINAVGDVLAINVDSNTGGGAGANIQLKTAGTSQLTINSSSATFAGSVGIGATSIFSGNKLDVRGGNIMVGGFGGGTDYGLILTPDDGSGYWNIANVTGGALTFNNSATIGSSEQMRLTTTGLGIGTTPSTKLHISGGDSAIRITPTGSNDPRIDFTDNGGTVRFYTGYDVSSGNFVITSDEGGFGSSNIMVMSDAGNVGIGTTSIPNPFSGAYSNILQVGTTGGNTRLAITAGSTSSSDLSFADSNDATNAGSYVGAISYKHNGDYMLFSTNGSEKMRIQSNGNVLIGTTGATNTRLKVVQTTASEWACQITNTGATSYGLAIDTSANTGVYALGVYTNTGTGLFVKNDGKVGIGVASPAAKLHVSGDTGGADSIARFQNTNSTAKSTRLQLLDSAGTVGDALIAYDHSNASSALHYLGMGVNNSTTLVINNNDKVGIGTTSPDEKLDITGGYLKFNGGDYGIKGSAGLTYYATSEHYFYTGGTERMRITSAGAIEIKGTSTTTSAQAFITNDNSVLSIGSSVSGSVVKDIQFNSPSPMMYIDGSAGNVGIGTTSPAAPLDVQGTGALFITRTSGGLATYIENDGGYPFMAMYQIGGGAKVLINTNGSSYFNGGAVGIGTTAPFSDLSINVGANAPSSSGNMASEGLTVHNAAGGRAVQIGVNESGAYNYIQSSYVNNSNVAVNLAFFTGASEKMRITSAGNVGIGTTAPTYKLQVNGTAYINETLYVNGETTVDDTLKVAGIIQITGTGVVPQSGAGIYRPASDTLGFFTSGASMRLNSTGDILLGNITTVGNTHASFDSASNDRMILNIGSSTTSSIDIVNFRNPNGIVGGINTDGFTTSFSSSSDYRLKENVVKMTDALDRVSQLKPSRFNFIGEEKTVDGFLAHEVSDIVPEAISGTKDAVDEKGNPIYQGIDQSKLVPLLVGAIQELKAEIENLKSQINN